jgi:sugar transferase (PEP-CTERM/EpsH1 system associated)
LIAHVIYRLDYGGLENGLVNLINGLPAGRFRHAIVCIRDYTDFRRRVGFDVDVRRLDKRDGQDWNLYARLWRAFRELRPDIVHTRNLAALEAQLPALFAGVRRRIHGEHGRDVHDLDNTRTKYRWMRRAVSPLVHHYTAVSRELTDYLVAEVGIAERKVTRICNGVDGGRFAPGASDRSCLRGAPFDGRGRFIVGTIGRMQPVKDQLTLARAFMRLVGSTERGAERLGLVLIGDGPLREQVGSELARAGMAGLAWLPGARSDTPELLRAFDVFVLPSLAEGISNTILEAMATGLPVVATNVGGNAELVRDGVNGTLVPRSDPAAMASAIERYRADPARAAAHGKASRERVEEEFDLPQMIERYRELYERVLAH